jgi:hypothetical protein
MATINPFMQPINYAVDVQSPFESALGGFKIGAGIAEIQAAQQKRDLDLKAQQEAKKRQTELADLYKNPNASSADFERLAPFLPKEQAEIVLKGFEAKTKREQDTDLRNGAQVYSAIKSGQPGIAIQMLTDQAAALRNGGRENEAKAAEDAAQGIELNPTAAQVTVGLYMARLPGGTGYLEAADKSLSTIRLETQAPAELRQKIAAAEKAESDAKTALATADNAQDKAKAEKDLAKTQADLAAIKLEFARPNEILDVQQKGRQLGLTDAQIKQAEAAIKASDAAAKKSGADADLAQKQANEIAAGVIPADKRPDAEAKFRKEYSDQTKGYQDIKAAYGRILAVSDPKTPDEEAPADLALVFNFMKMQDPGSTVNSGEFANAQNSAGVPDRVVNLYNNLLKGSRLSPTQRKAFRGQAENLYKVTGQQEATVRKGIDRIAKGYGLNTQNIFYTETEVAPVALGAPSGNSVTVNGQTYTRPANFSDAQWNAYKQSMGVQ